MEKVSALLNDFNKLSEMYKENSQVLKHINMYITICENSINSNIPLSSLYIERFGKIIEVIKNIK